MVVSVADAVTSVCVLARPAVPGDVMAAEGLAYSAAKLLLCLFLVWQRTVCMCVSSQLVSSLSSSGRTAGIVMYCGDKLSDPSTEKVGLFGRGLHGHFPCSVQMRGSTVDTVPGTVLEVFGSTVPSYLAVTCLVSVPSENTGILTPGLFQYSVCLVPQWVHIMRQHDFHTLFFVKVDLEC